MHKIAILYDASQAVLSTFDLDEVLRQILAIARDYFHLQNVAILLLEKDKQELYPRCQIGWDPGHETLRLPIGNGLTGAAATQVQEVLPAVPGQYECIEHFVITSANPTATVNGVVTMSTSISRKWRRTASQAPRAVIPIFLWS